jgi:hypothetical protein
VQVIDAVLQFQGAATVALGDAFQLGDLAQLVALTFERGNLIGRVLRAWPIHSESYGEPEAKAGRSGKSTSRPSQTAGSRGPMSGASRALGGRAASHRRLFQAPRSGMIRPGLPSTMAISRLVHSSSAARFSRS